MKGASWMDIRSDRQKGLSYVELGKKYHMDQRTAKCQRRCDFVVFRRTGNVEKWCSVIIVLMPSLYCLQPADGLDDIPHVYDTTKNGG